MSAGVGAAEMKCKKCRYFYRVMVTKEGYNPYPCCHILEDTGERPKPLTQECFKPRRRTKKEADSGCRKRVTPADSG